MVGTARYVFVVFDLTNEYSPSLLKKVRTSLVEAAMSRVDSRRIMRACYLRRSINLTGLRLMAGNCNWAISSGCSNRTVGATRTLARNRSLISFSSDVPALGAPTRIRISSVPMLLVYTSTM